MIYFFRWIFGYVTFSFKKGFAEDFLSYCFNEGIELRNVEKKDDYITACCNLKNYKRLHTIARRSGGIVKIINKKGLPFLLLPLKNRIGFFVGALCFLAVISFLNTFIWSVEIVGNERVGDMAIMAYLESNNLKKGTMWSSVDKEKLAWDMMSEFDDFSWVHINETGTTALIEVNERRQSPVPDEDKLQGRDILRKEITVTVSREQKNVKLKDSKCYYSINFFTAEIPVYFKKQKGDTSAKSSSFLTIKDKTLPIGYTKYEENFFSSESSSMNDDELKALAKKRIGFKESEEFDAFEIVNKTEDYQLDETRCVATFSYIVRRK